MCLHKSILHASWVKNASTSQIHTQRFSVLLGALVSCLCTALQGARNGISHKLSSTSPWKTEPFCSAKIWKWFLVPHFLSFAFLIRFWIFPIVSCIWWSFRWVAGLWKLSCNWLKTGVFKFWVAAKVWKFRVWKHFFWSWTRNVLGVWIFAFSHRLSAWKTSPLIHYCFQTTLHKMASFHFKIPIDSFLQIPSQTSLLQKNPCNECLW